MGWQMNSAFKVQFNTGRCWEVLSVTKKGFFLNVEDWSEGMLLKENFDIQLDYYMKHNREEKLKNKRQFFCLSRFKVFCM